MNIHYKVGDRTYYNNIDALAAFTKDAANDLEFVLPFKFLNNHKLWLKEPPFDVTTYMDMNTKALRDRYTRLELRYSGGTDSHTVLRSFNRTNTPCYIKHLQSSEVHLKWSMRLWDYNKPYMKQVAAQDNVLGFDCTHIGEMTCEKFDRYIQTYQGHCGTALLHTPAFIEGLYDQANNTTRVVNETTGYVYGLEKPYLVIDDGWWCWQMNDAMFSDCHWNFEQGNIVWFFFSDDVPELHIKQTWLRIRAIEHIARIEKLTTISSQWLDQVQKSKSKWYDFLNDFCGYTALNRLNGTVFTKLSDPNGTRLRDFRDYMDKAGVTKLYQEYGQDIRKNLREDFYKISNANDQNGFHNEAVVHVAGVWTKKIPVRPVTPDLLTDRVV